MDKKLLLLGHRKPRSPRRACNSHLAPVSMSVRKIDPSLDTEKAVVSSDVTAMAVTESLHTGQFSTSACPWQDSLSVYPYGGQVL